MQKNPYMETIVANSTNANGMKLCYYYYPDAVRTGRAGGASTGRLDPARE